MTRAEAVVMAEGIPWIADLLLKVERETATKCAEISVFEHEHGTNGIGIARAIRNEFALAQITHGEGATSSMRDKQEL